MTKNISKRQFLLGTVAISSLALFGCGGTTSAPTSSLNVTPVLGAVYGGLVSVYNSSGILLGTGTTSSQTGKVTVTLTGYTAGTPVIIKVVLGAGASYFNEATGAVVTLGTGESASLLSVMPSFVSGQAVGVTPLTTLAAAVAGVTAGAGGVTTSTTLTANTIAAAVGSTLLALGLPTNLSLTAEPDAATLAQPVPSDTMGKILAALAKDSGDPVAQVAALVALVSAGAITSDEALTSANLALQDSSLISEYGFSVTVSAPLLPSDAGYAAALAAAVTAVKEVFDAELTPATGTGSDGISNGG